MDLIILLILGGVLYWGFYVGQESKPQRSNRGRSNNCRCRNRRR